MKPLVSIITPSYNQGKFIRETIESVLSQDYENIEYIVVDGGSTDNSLAIIKEYEDKLSYISEKDNGQSDAINKGFKMAKGEIVAWLNSDDVYEPGCISRAVEEFEKNDKLGLVYGDGYIIDDVSNKLKVFEYTQEFDYWKLVNFWDYIMQPATFFKREKLQQVGYLDENLHYCMDWDLWIKLASISEVKYIPELLACSREYGNTKTSTGGDKRLEEIIQLLQKYSGKKNPLGAVSYKASTFYTKHANAMWPVSAFARWYLNHKHKWLNEQMPVKHTDGWIGKTYAMVVPGYIRKITFFVDVAITKNLPQQVLVCINGKKAEDILITQCGTEKIEILIEDNRVINEITLECSHAIKGYNNDTRQLALKISDVVMSENA